MSSATVTAFRLSPQQRHLWSFQRTNPAFNAWVAIVFDGAINVARLQKTLNDIVARHEILRTTYHSLSGMKIPVQVITEFPPLVLHTTDGPVEIDEFIATQANEMFDPERGPLVRAALVKLTPDRHLLVVTLSPMCADTLTLRNLFQEIAGAERESDEQIQYLQFSEWQHELLEENDADEGREYWSKQKLDSLLDSETKSFDPAVFRFAIDTTKLSALAERFHVSLSDLLFACWQVLNWRLNDQEETVVGRSFDGRKYEELENAFGIFSKTLPLRVDLNGEKRFSEIIRATADQSRDAEQWQDYFVWPRDEAFVKLAFEYFEAPQPTNLDEVSTVRGSGWVLTPADPSATAGGTDLIQVCSLYRCYSCPDPYLLKLVCIRENESVAFELHYDRESINNIERIAAHFETLLQSVVNDPFKKIARLEILNDAQRQEIFKALTGRVAPVPRTCIHELFEQQAAQWPERIAVACGHETITYQQLDERANQLAHRLRRLGVGPEIAVGICLPASIEMLVAILGVLKAGGFYVPLDPAYPHDRLSFILDDTRAAVLITERSIAAEIASEQLTSLFIDEERDALNRESTAKPDAAATPEHLAYVIYTSGSTGRPKGVLVSHENVVHSTVARSVYYEESLTTYLLLSSFSFDSSVAGLFWTLCNGATLLLPSGEVRREIPALIKLIREHDVSHLLCLPSLYALLLEAAAPEDLDSLRCVIVAGEACPLELPEKHRRISHAGLYNEYGPTEGTVWASVYKIEPNVARQIPIGGPIANTQIYILDSQLQPVPFGVSGELFIGGRGITRGYQNLPGLTAEKFVPDQLGTRLYRTGDRVRCRPTGEIDFLGRFDQQIKLRGYRIELGEIEAVLAQFPPVQELACIVEQIDQDDDRLLAYVVARPDQTLNKTDLAAHARERLPEFMVPAHFILLDSLPLLPNGKLNRNALLESVEVANDQERTFVPPSTPTEELLAEIWSEVLKTNRIGIHDNFFDLGGHSFLAIKAHSRLSKTLGREVPLLKLFEYPTLQSLASFLEQTDEQPVPVAQTQDWAEKRRQAIMGRRADNGQR